MDRSFLKEYGDITRSPEDTVILPSMLRLVVRTWNPWTTWHFRFNSTPSPSNTRSFRRFGCFRSNLGEGTIRDPPLLTMPLRLIFHGRCSMLSHPPSTHQKARNSILPNPLEEARVLVTLYRLAKDTGVPEFFWPTSH